ncbi:MAG: tetratricopeptide repeat protein [Kiloniellaceae bacterium]
MMSFVVRGLIVTLWLGLAAGPVLAAGSSSSSSPAKTQDSAYTKAQDLIAASKFQAAVPLLQKAIAADPKSADAYNLLGFSQRKLGNKENAFASYQKALALEPEHLGANEYLGELYLETGQIEKARERLEILDGACFLGCDEYRELKAAIKTYRPSNGG